MSKFTPEEIAYLQDQRLGRLATVGANGEPHVVPVGFRYNPEHDSIDIGGFHMGSTKKYRDAIRYGRAAFVVDDVLPPWQPRMLEIRGTVEGLSEGGKEIMPQLAPEIVRITPTRIISFGLNTESEQPEQGPSSRKVG
ncbi:PPOX class F420-dependent oxidoreductase [Ktedonosporobacter rubrisoli]|uniref:PPOX class F420-dependent oxidoreductase n=2 Tax=Ktedonosporobacter rubrisoli TaxID=2509675 RepID=A0A4P6K586_KTERU|nr:PPOX class F420-dependent oxidoreductase [Ktedonosporobacter rubrisoli]